MERRWKSVSSPVDTIEATTVYGADLPMYMTVAMS